MADSLFLPVVETFHSLQGEGHHAGRSAFFIRLAGCTVGCPWCDTKNSWPVSEHPLHSIEALAEEARQAKGNGAAFVVITGGEPLHHNLQPLTNVLDERCQLPLHLETSGVDELSGRFDWITLSPKRHRHTNQHVAESCHELKVVIHNEEDLIYSERIARKTNQEAQHFLQPGWGDRRATELTINYILKNSTWRLSNQTHKILGIL